MALPQTRTELRDVAIARIAIHGGMLDPEPSGIIDQFQGKNPLLFEHCLLWDAGFTTSDFVGNPGLWQIQFHTQGPGYRISIPSGRRNDI